MLLKSFHHVALRCRDSQETADFYTGLLGAKFVAALRARTRHADNSEILHTFFQLEDGSHIAFFELPERTPQGWDPNTPRWVQHFAFAIADLDVQLEMKTRLEAAGVEVDGPKNGPTCTSIYFSDPSGNRLELAVPHKLDAKALAEEASRNLAQWNIDRVELLKSAGPVPAAVDA